MVERSVREPRRADAERNIASILDAGLLLLSSDPTASVTEIAKAAGVGRVTLYGHFSSREALVDAVLSHAIALAERALEDESLDRLPAPEAVASLVRSSWEILDRHRRLFVAADRVLPGERIRRHHDGPLKRVERLIVRGQADGDFRTDLPLSWLLATFFSVLHNAAQEVEAGRLARDEAERVLLRTLTSLLAPT